MLEEIKVNLLEVFFANNKQTALDPTKNNSTQVPNKNVGQNNESFMNIMNNLQARPEANPQASKKTENFNMESKKIEPAKIINATKAITKEIKEEVAQTAEPTTKAVNSAPEKVSDEKKSEDQEVNYMVLSEMKKQIDQEIEEISKAIAGLDLSTATGIDQILELSDTLEALRSVENLVLEKLSEIDLPLDKQLLLEDVELSATNEVSISLENMPETSINIQVEQPTKNKLENYISKNVQDLVDTQIKALENTESNSPLLQSNDNKIENTENNLKSIKDLVKTISKSEAKDQNIVLEKTKNVEVKDIKIEQKLIDPNLVKNLNSQERIIIGESDMSEDMSILGTEETGMIPSMEETFGAEMSDMEADSFNQNAQTENPEIVQVTNTEFKSGDVFRVNSRIQIHKNPVSLNELSNVVSREVTKVSPGGKQEITMSLTPGDLGQIELSISRGTNNKLEIKMVFTQDNALNTVEHKLTELRSILKSRGFEAQIELSKSESTSTDNFNRPGQESFNEAREEQKERILATMPEWLRPDSDTSSFQSTLQQII